MAALDGVGDYVTKARELLQDQAVGNYRYADAELVSALALSLPEAKLLRPDLFLTGVLQNFTVSDIAANTAVSFDPMYRMALVYYMCGQAQLRDDEETQDQRAAAFLSMFTSKLRAGV